MVSNKEYGLGSAKQDDDYDGMDWSQKTHGMTEWRPELRSLDCQGVKSFWNHGLDKCEVSMAVKINIE